MKDGEIETRLGGQAVAHSASFIELLAPERRASIFQSTAADTENNAKLLKALLMLATAVNVGPGGTVNEENATTAAKEFGGGDDAARVHRQLYAASRLLQKGVGFQTAYELAEAARSSADAGLTVPALTLAIQADEFRVIRARAIAAGGTPDIPEAPRNVLSNLLRGRIEDLTGWALFNQDKLDEAVDHLKRAVSILPAGTPAANTSLWHLGAALERQDKKSEALNYYIKSYNSGEPDAVRRAIIEQLYRKVNGSLEGLDARIGPGSASLSSTAPENASGALTQPAASSSPESAPAATPEPAPEKAVPTGEASPTPAATPESTPAPTPAATPVDGPTGPTSPVPPSSPSASPEATPAGSKTEAPTESVPATPAETPRPTSSPAPSPTTEGPAPSPSPTTEAPAPSDSTSSAATSSLSSSPVEKLIAPPRATVTITGRVKDEHDNPLANVVVVLISPLGTVLASTTDDQGNFSFTVATSSVTRSYRIIPSKDGLAFDRVVPVGSDDEKDLNFVGKPIPKP